MLYQIFDGSFLCVSSVGDCKRRMKEVEMDMQTLSQKFLLQGHSSFHKIMCLKLSHI